MAIKVKLHELAGADARQLGLARRAAAALERALNRPEFAGRVATAPYKETRFSDGDKSCSVPPAEVYDLIASGAERGTAADGVIDLRIRVADLHEGVVGLTTPGTLPFCTSRWFLDGCRHVEDVVSLARHFIHEWLHVAGFYHHPDNEARDDVAYLVGDIVRDLLLREGLPENARMAKALDEGRCGAAGEGVGAG